MALTDQQKLAAQQALVASAAENAASSAAQAAYEAKRDAAAYLLLAEDIRGKKKVLGWADYQAAADLKLSAEASTTPAPSASKSTESNPKK